MKMLSAEEERVCDIDDVSLLKTDLQQAKLGPALCTFKASVEELATYIAFVPSAEISAEPMNKYFWSDIIRSLDALHQQELNIAIDRWKDLCVNLCNDIRQAFPDQWKAKAIDTYDEQYVRGKVLQQSVIDGLGSDYSYLNLWFKGLEEIKPIHEAFQKRWETELKHCKEATIDAVDLTATILCYNTMIFNLPKQSPGERRQSYKDVKIKSKPNLESRWKRQKR